MKDLFNLYHFGLAPHDSIIYVFSRITCIFKRGKIGGTMRINIRICVFVDNKNTPGLCEPQQELTLSRKICWSGSPASWTTPRSPRDRAHTSPRSPQCSARSPVQAQRAQLAIQCLQDPKPPRRGRALSHGPSKQAKNNNYD